MKPIPQSGTYEELYKNLRKKKKVKPRKCKHDWRYMYKYKFMDGSTEIYFYCTKCLEIREKIL